MISEKPKNVGILRPISTSMERLYDSDKFDYYERLISELIDQVVDLIRNMLLEVAKTLKIRLKIIEYQLFYIEKSKRIVSKARSRDICENDILVSLDPSVDELSYLNGAIDTHALQRGIVAFTASSVFEDLYALIGAKRIPILKFEAGHVKYQKLPKLFSVYVPLNDDDKIDEYDNSMNVIEMAMRYPDITAIDSTKDHFMRLFISDSSARESQDDFKDNLVSK